MRKLEDIIEDYENARVSLRSIIASDTNYKDALLEMQHRLLDLRADLRPWHTKMLKASELRSDKQATAIKHRIGLAMVKGEYEFKDGEKPMYEKLPTISNAEKYASASREYKEFLEQKVFYKESFVNIADLREEIASFVLLVKDKLKYQ